MKSEAYTNYQTTPLHWNHWRRKQSQQDNDSVFVTTQTIAVSFGERGLKVSLMLNAKFKNNKFQQGVSQVGQGSPRAVAYLAHVSSRVSSQSRRRLTPRHSLLLPVCGCCCCIIQPDDYWINNDNRALNGRTRAAAEIGLLQNLSFGKMADFWSGGAGDSMQQQRREQ